jgi:hypothetical protein
MIMLVVKIKALRLLVTAKQWANTEKGENVIVSTLTIMSAIGILCLALVLSEYL